MVFVLFPAGMAADTSLAQLALDTNLIRRKFLFFPNFIKCSNDLISF